MKCQGVYLSFALAEYQRQHGTCPESLQALAPVIIVDLPLDPFSGKDFIYRCDAGTYQLYSTGLNQIDDQGKEDAFSNTFEALDFVIH